MALTVFVVFFSGSLCSTSESVLVMSELAKSLWTSFSAVKFQIEIERYSEGVQKHRKYIQFDARIRLVSNWYPIGIKLVSNWYPLGIHLVFNVNYHLKSRSLVAQVTPSN